MLSLQYHRTIRNFAEFFTGYFQLFGREIGHLATVQHWRILFCFWAELLALHPGKLGGGIARPLTVHNLTNKFFVNINKTNKRWVIPQNGVIPLNGVIPTNLSSVYRSTMKKSSYFSCRGSLAENYSYQRILNDLWRTKLSRRRIIWLFPHPLPFSYQQVVSFSVFLTINI